MKKYAVVVTILMIYVKNESCHNAKLSRGANNESMKKLAETPFDKNESLVN
jgi:hypothetical protein